MLTESIWCNLDEDTKNYFNRWEKELWPLLEEYRVLSEAELTANQISGIFQDAEKFAIDSGKYRSIAGKAGDAASTAGKAVTGTVKLAAGTVSKVNAKINDLGKMIQDTTPVKGLDAAFEKAKKDLYVKLGGKDSKVVAAVEKMAQVAKDHPGKTKFLIGLLSAATVAATGGTGGAVAGFMLRVGNDLLTGEKLSTAIGKGAKTAVLSYLSGKAFQYLSNEVKEYFATANKDELMQTATALQNAKVTDAVNAAELEHGAMRDAWVKAFPGGSVELKVSENTNGLMRGFHGVLTNAQHKEYQELTRAASSALSKGGIEDSIKASAKAWNFLEQIKATTDQSALLQLNRLGTEAKNAILDAGEAALKDPELKAQLSKLVGDAAKDTNTMAAIADTAAALAQGAVTAAPKTKAQRDKEAEKQTNEESIDYELIYTKHMAGIPLTESEQQVVNEIGWADIKKGAAKAGAAIAKGVAKAGGAVAGKVKGAAKELGNQITAKKLTSLWNKAGKPTDAQSVSNVLAQAGMEPDDVTTVSKELPAPSVPTSKPEPETEPKKGATTQAAPATQSAQAGSEQPAATAQQQPAQTQEPAQQGQDSGTAQPSAQGTTSGAASTPNAGAKKSAGAIKQGVGQAQTGSLAPNTSVTGSNKLKYTWDGKNWKDPKGNVATGAMHDELMKAKGLDREGNPVKPGVMQRAKDWISGKTPGAGQATRSDPTASVGKKLAGTLGAKIGSMFDRNPAQPGAEQPAQAPQAGAEQPAQAQAPQPGAEQPAQAQAPQPGAEQPASKKPLPNVSKSEYSALQQRTMNGDAAAAKELVDRLVNASSQNYDVNDYANSIGPILKRANIDKNLKTVLTQKARALRTESYHHLAKVLEAGGLTWDDLGYHVLISESNADAVLLLPIHDVDMYEMKQLAGI